MSNVSTQTMQKFFTAPARPFAAYINLQGLATTLTRVLKAWRQGASANTRLYHLNSHVRRDIGITDYNIGHGPAESFWRD